MDIETKKNLTQLHTFGVPWTSDYFGVVSNRDEVRDAVIFSQKEEVPLFILGGGSNILPTERFKGLVVHNQIMGREIVTQEEDSVTVRVGAGENWHEFVLWCVEHGYHGLENLALIPGTVGGAVVQNIGAYDVDVQKYITQVEAIELETGNEKIFTHDECDFGYRQSTFKGSSTWCVVAVVMELSRAFTPVLTYKGLREHLEFTADAQQVLETVVTIRKEKLPDWKVCGTAGSFFANPRVSDAVTKKLKRAYPDMPVFHNYGSSESTIPAGWLIEHARLDQTVRDNFLYDKHALVLINQYKGTDTLPLKYGKQIEHAVLKIKKTVTKDFGITLVPEVLIL